MRQLAAHTWTRHPFIRVGRDFDITEPNKFEALLGQITGQENVSKCTQCEKREGPWEKCVSAAGFFLEACANCYYGNDGEKCSSRK